MKLNRFVFASLLVLGKINAVNVKETSERSGGEADYD